jgi:DNA-binding MarR family transcriptional regulator
MVPRPHPALRIRTAFTLRFVADRMRRAVAEALKEDITTWCEFAALTVACELSGLSQNGLAERTAIDRTRISEAIERLEDHALITRREGPQGRRLVYATESGRELRRDLELAVAQAERAALLPLNPRERARLWELLAKAIPHDRGLFGF